MKQQRLLFIFSSVLCVALPCASGTAGEIEVLGFNIEHRVTLITNFRRGNFGIAGEHFADEEEFNLRDSGPSGQSVLSGNADFDLSASHPNGKVDATIASVVSWNLDRDFGRFRWESGIDAVSNYLATNAYTEVYEFSSGVKFKMLAKVIGGPVTVNMVVAGSAFGDGVPVRGIESSLQLSEDAVFSMPDIFFRGSISGRSIRAPFNFDETRTAVFLYSIDDKPLPGSAPTAPLFFGRGPFLGIPDVVIDDVRRPQPADEPGLIAGINLRVYTSAPVIEGSYGNTENVYFETERAVGYGFSTNDTNQFRTFEIPESLAQGDETFEILHDNRSYPLAAGETFDFRSIDPAGVDSFVLLGIDEPELAFLNTNGSELAFLSTIEAPFVYGATFMEAGSVSLWTIPLVAVPEPSSMLLAVATLGMVFGRRR